MYLLKNYELCKKLQKRDYQIELWEYYIKNNLDM